MWGILLFLWVFYIVPVSLLKIPYIQEKVAGVATGELEKRLGTEVRISRIDFEVFNKLILKDIYLEDQSGDTLLHANRLAVGFDLLPMFKGKLLFSSAQLFSFKFNLTKESAQSPLNLQFVIDAFASKDTVQKNNKIDLQIQNLNLRRGSFSYHVKDEPEMTGKFDSKHIEMKDISAKIHINQLNDTLLDAKIDRLAFFEKSGLNVSRLVFDLRATDSIAKINRLELQLTNTLLQLENITADYPVKAEIHEYVEKTLFHLSIEPSTIVLKELSPFLPVFSNFTNPMTIEGDLSGNINDFKLRRFHLTDRKDLMLQANLQLMNATNKDNIYISGIVDRSFISPEGIHRIVNNFSKGEQDLPSPVYQLGNVRFEGRVTGYLHHLTAYGLFDTDIGSVRTDINIGKDDHLFIKGNIHSQGINLKKLFQDNSVLGDVAFNINIDAHQTADKQFFGVVDANVGKFEFKNYFYENIQIAGNFTNNSFKGLLNVDSPDGHLESEGYFKLNGRDSEFNFLAKAYGVKLEKLNLSKKYKESDLSFNIGADFTGDNIDNLNGDISLSNLMFRNEKGSYFFDTLAIRAFEQGPEKVLKITSDIIHGEIRGMYSFKSIGDAVKRTLNDYLPSLIPVKEPVRAGPENNFSINLTVEDLKDITYIFDLPFTLQNESKIVGQYNSIYNKFRLEAYFPAFDVKGSNFESGKLIVENSGSEITGRLDAVNLRKNKKKLLFSTNLTVGNDILNTEVNWDQVDSLSNYSGTLSFATAFTNRTGKYPMGIRVDIKESTLIFNDSVWTLHPASVVIDSGKIVIDDLIADHSNQYLKIKGTVSNDEKDVLFVDLNQVNLDYIFTTLAIKALEFGGAATGSVRLADLYNTRRLTTDLHVTDFTFNKVLFGTLDLKGSWDDERQGVIMDGFVFKNDTSFLDVKGMLYPVKEELSFHFDILNGDAAILRKYLGSIAKDISGEVTGNIHLFGTFSKPTMEGNVFIREGRFGVEFLNTYYTFSDSVLLTPDRISIKDALLYDKYGRAAILNGYVTHQYFEDFNFSVGIQADHFLVFDATERQNPLFYGSAFGTGSATIRGTEQLVNIDVSMKSNPNTKITLNFMEEDDISEYDFINFVSPSDDTTSVDRVLAALENKPILLKTNLDTDIRFNLLLEANSDAVIELIMDPIAGDKIKGYGNGNLQIQYGTKSPLKMFGNYVIEKGSYNFSMQQVIFRDFDIREGSSVSFKGDPYNAELDIDAIYTVTANLGDLDENLIAETPRTNVLVNCVLGITGNMAHPMVSFDIELPASNEELERQIKSIINTDDMMNRQIVYLLVLNKFYTIQNYSRGNSAGTNDLASIASATLSSQLSNLLSSISDNIQIGTRIKANDSEFTDTEVALLLSSQLLNNRLILNGNFGYRDNKNIGKDQSKFVGDFDLEYKLTRTGDIRLKAYNHYNENYYNLKTAQTTQGLGIMFKKDFNSLRDIFHPRSVSSPLPDSSKLTMIRDTVPVSYVEKDNFIFFRDK